MSTTGDGKVVVRVGTSRAEIEERLIDIRENRLLGVLKSSKRRSSTSHTDTAHDQFIGWYRLHMQHISGWLWLPFL